MMRMKKGIVLAAALALMTLPVQGLALADVQVYEQDTWLSDEEEEEEDGRFDEDSGSDKASGPAKAIAGQEEGQPADPEKSVKRVSLGEQYHEDYGVYEQSLNDSFFIYATVANGGITDEPVTIDVPANVNYTMEKDGVPIPYITGQAVGERGTYVMRFTATENQFDKDGKLIEFSATFRFRIQEKLPESERPGYEEEDSRTADGRGSDGEELNQSSFYGNGYIPPAVSDDLDTLEAEEETEETEAAEEEGIKETEVVIGEGQTESEEEGSESAEAGADGQAGEPAAEGKNPRVQTYNDARKCYLVTLENGRELVSNIPEGFVSNTAVEVILPEGDTCKLYRNDEEIEYVRGDSLTEDGVYRFSLDGADYSFRIASAVNDMEVYPAPGGMRFTEVYFNEEPVELQTDSYVLLSQDGTYRFVMEGEAGQRLESSLIRDTQAPDFNVSIDGGTASVQYLSEDIDSITLERDGERVANFAGNTIDSPGEYRLTVADQAGNSKYARFTLKYSVNLYGIFAVILCLLTAAGGVAFFVHTKKTIKIR